VQSFPSECDQWLLKVRLQAELLKATDHIQMEKIALELGALSDQIDNGTMRWLELSEMM